MNIPRIAIRRPVLTSVVLIILFLFGAFSLFSMELDLLPDINLPVAVVITPYDDAGPQEVEQHVTEVVEEAMATVGGAETIRSTSREGSSMVMVEFDWGTDLDSATFDMREALDLVTDALPDDADDSRVLQFDPGMLPILTLSVAGLGDLSEMQAVTEDVIAPRLERIEGVASVDVDGTRDQQVQVRLDPVKLEQYGIALDQLGELIMAANLNVPGGTFAEGATDLTVRTLGEFESIDDVKNVTVPTADGDTLQLRDLGHIEKAPEPTQSLTRLDDEPSLALSINRESGANTVRVSESVQQTMNELADELPAGLDVATIMDQGDFIVVSIRNVLYNGLAGGLLAILVLLFFLRDWRSTVVTAVAIPFSAIIAFTFIYFAGLTMNLLSMGGLALGIGMMVDNAIVVLENIFRKLTDGASANDAAITGTREVGGAITASTLTTLSVFLPIIFTEGLAAEIFRDLSLTVSFALVASLLVALTGIPLLASRLLRRHDASPTSTQRTPLITRYRHFLTWSLTHRKWVVGILVLALMVGGFSAMGIDTQFLPSIDDGTLMIDVDMPPGTPLEETDRIMEKLETALRELPEVASILTFSGTSAGLAAGEDADSTSGQIQLTLVDRRIRERSAEAVAEATRAIARDIPGPEISVTAGMMTEMAEGGEAGLGGPDIEVEFRGDDLDRLQDITEALSDQMGDMPGVYDIQTSFDEGAPELRLQVDRQRAANFGLSSAQIGQTVRAASAGQVVTRYRADEQDLEVIVQFTDEALADRDRLLRIPIHTPDGDAHVPLMEVAELKEAVGPVTVERTDQSRSASVSAQMTGESPAEATQEIGKGIEALDLPPGYSYSFEGEQALIDETFGDLFWVALMGFALMYLIMAAQFESFVFPLSVILTVPMSLVGVAVILAATGRPFDVGAFVGLIMVMGIIVNNAIVMVDYINQIRRQGRPRHDAIREAAGIRLRPVLMTALTTILAMVPLALGIGQGAEIQVPLATTVMGGLITGTLLTLVVLPVLYSLIDDLFGGRRQAPKDQKEVTPNDEPL